MKSSVYYCRLSGGNVYRVEFATSAGEAIHQAIWLHRGNIVTECWQGPASRRVDERSGVNFDVPAHSPVPHDAIKPKATRKKDESEAFEFLASTPVRAK